MPATWTLLERRLLREASAVEKLERYVVLKYGQDMADQMRSAIQNIPPGRLTAALTKKFSDPKLDDLVMNAVEELGGPVKHSIKRDPDFGRFQKIEPHIKTREIDPEKTGKVQGPQRFPGDRPGKMGYRQTDAVTKALARLRWNKKADPGQFMMWMRQAGEEVSKREADDILYYYSRPEGGEILGTDPKRPGIYYYQGPAKGSPTAPQGAAPSSGVPEPVGDEPTVRTAQPGEEPPAEEPPEEPEEPGAPERPTGFQDPARIKGVKPSQQIAAVAAQRAKEKESGLRDIQRKIWRIAQDAGPAAAEPLARQHNIPIPDTVMVKNAAGQKVPQPKILSADQLARMGAPSTVKTKAVAGGREVPVNRIAGYGVNKPPFRGSFVGQVWRPNGVSQMVKRWFANLATGNWQRMKRETNPGIEGNEVVWDGKDWVPAESWVMRAMERQISPRTTGGQDVPMLPSWWPRRKAGLEPGGISGPSGWGDYPEEPADERDTERMGAPEPDERLFPGPRRA